MKKLTFVAAAAAMIALTNSGFAQVIATYNASGIVQGSDPTSLAATNVATNLTASSMTVAYGHYANTLAGNAFGFANDGTVITSLAAAISADSYFTVTLTPASGQVLNISGIDLSGYFDSQTNGTATYYLEASVGNGFGSGSGNILAQWNPGKPSLGPGIINVSGNPAFQNVTGPVELRIYVEEPDAYYQDEVGGDTGGDDSVNIDGTLAPMSPPGSVIATYNASGIVQGSDPTSLAATNVATNLTAGPMTVAYGHYANTLAGNAFGFANDGTVITSLAAAVSADSYFTVTLTPASGQVLNISGIDLSGYFDSQTSGTATYYLEASVGNGFGSGSGNILAQWNPGKPSLGPGVINVSGNPAFQNVAGPVELRIYVEEPDAYYQDEVGGKAGGDDSVNIDGSIVAAGPANPGLPTMGINLTDDWLFADCVRSCGFSTWDTGTNWIGGPCTVSSAGWPTEDFAVVLWAGVPNDDGTYAISFNGIAKVALSDTSWGTITPQNTNGTTGNYNSATNTTTATMVVTDTGAENFALIFTNTQLTSGSATDTGVTNLQVYRPVSEGSTSSYTAGTLFTNQTLAVGEKFSTVRFVWLSEAIDSLATNWSDRNPPTNRYQGDGSSSPSSANTPMAYEYMVAYCNATNTDLYLNIPVYATDTYVTDLADLVKYGSNGANPYTSVQTSPAYPPLNSNLHVYLEYSNEVWNPGYDEQKQNYNIVVADSTANNAEWSILNYDGVAASNLWYGAWRRVGLRALEISNDFRAVFGNAAMPPNANPTVRPLLEYQADNGQATGSTQLHFLSDYYNNADGVAHVTTPEPVNYFLWGGGGATYYNSNDDTAATVDALFASGIPDTGYAGMVQTDSGYEKGYGLKRVAYEGGWSPDNGTNGYENLAGSAAALAKYDPRATTSQEDAQTVFQQSGGDLNIFYNSSSWDVNSIFSMTDQIFNLTTPLYEAMDSIASSTPAAITYGNAISGTVATTLAYGSQIFAESTYSKTLPDNGTLGWVPLISTAGNYQISLNINSTTSGKYVRVLVDGQTIGGGAISVPVSSSPQNVVVATVNLTAGQHGLLVEGQYASNDNYSGTSCTFTSVVLTP